MSAPTRQVAPDALRLRFSQALSRMYRLEVPAYGTLLDLVARVNHEVQARAGTMVAAGAQPLLSRLAPAPFAPGSGGVERLAEERHGAIRVGTAAELSWLKRLFALIGLQPVGYYDLSAAGLPVHSTAFRPVTAAALAHSPFRVFTSLLRVDLLADAGLRATARRLLGARDIFPPGLRERVQEAERDGGVDEAAVEPLLAGMLEVFRWHGEASARADEYRALLEVHALVADVVCFRGPHINHLTPRTLDIDAVQARMASLGMTPKDLIEGPPRRRCPILLRQTSFRALQETVHFRNAQGTLVADHHTARFGEVEQRGAALTPAGRALYDRLLACAQRAQACLSHPTSATRAAVLRECFQDFPDHWQKLHERGLVWFEYHPVQAHAALDTQDVEDRRDTQRTQDAPASAANGAREPPLPVDAEARAADLLARGLVRADPLTYEDFLPVSAAGIFRSNLRSAGSQAFEARPARAAFEDALGTALLDEQTLYANFQQRSLARCLASFHAQGVPS